MNSLAYFPWHALISVCLLCVLFLWLFLRADHHLDLEYAARLERDETIRKLTRNLDTAEDDVIYLAEENGELRELVAQRDAVIEAQRTEIERLQNPRLRGTQSAEVTANV